MKYLKKYGDMLARLNLEISRDLKGITYDELLELEKIAKVATLRNSSWWECKVSKTVFEHIVYEKRMRERGPRRDSLALV